MQENSDTVDFDVSGYAASLGVPALTCGGSLEEVLTSRWCLPSLTIADIRSSTTDDYAKRFGPTRFSVVPHFAQVSMLQDLLDLTFSYTCLNVSGGCSSRA